MKVFEFCYTDCIYESAAGTVSIHFSKKGAYDAMKKHKLELYNDWMNKERYYKKRFKPDFAKGWYIHETEVLN